MILAGRSPLQRIDHRPSARWSRRSVLGTVLACGLVAAAPARAAEIRSLEIIAPAGPGGGYDQLARATQEVLEKHGLASGVQVTNIPGAGGTIGLAQFVTKSARSPSLMVAGLGMVGAIHINKSPVSLDQVQPLARLTGEYQPLVVAADSPIKSLGDLTAKFKADPGSVSWGGFALGSPDHILVASIVKAVGGDVGRMNYIVAGAGGEMLAQVMGGHITVATGGLNEFAQQIQAGRLRALGISSPERLPGVDIPTFKEQGVDVTLVNWRGLMAPAKLRANDKKALDAAVGEMAKSPEWQAILKERGWVDMYQPSDQFAAFLAEERPRIEGILKDTGLIK
jgi:putative tricarboxylic transport membrane protein